MTVKFSRRSELLQLVCPPERASLEVWHATEEGFGARIMRESRRTGRTLRVYLYRYRDPDTGKDVKKRLGAFDEIDYDAAQDMVRAQKRDASLRRSGIEVRKRPTLAEGLATYLRNKEGSLADATVAQYRQMWALLDDRDARLPARQQPFTEVTRMHELQGDWWLDKYLSVLRQRGRATALSFYRVAHAVYGYHVRLRNLTENPVVRVSEDQNTRQPPPSKQIIPAAQMPTFWHWLNYEAQPATRDVLLVALFSGLRIGVISGLRWTQVNFERRCYIVPAEERGNKAKREVEMPICDELWARVFEPRHRLRSSDNEWVIASSKRSGEAARSVRSALDGLLARRGIKASPHTLRRTFATLAQLATRDPLLVSRMLTHSVKSTTRDMPAVSAGYVHYEEDELRRGFNTTAAFILERCQPPAA